MLGTWQLYGWHDYLLMQGDIWHVESRAWAREGELLFNLARDWYSLPHRQYPFRDRAVGLMLSRPPVTDYFARVRERWVEELRSAPDLESLRLLLARFDPENYKCSPRDDSTILVTFEWPEPLRQQTEAAAKESGSAITVLHFPLRCRTLLDQRQALDPTEIDEFWESLQKVAVAEPPPEEGLTSGCVASAVCAGVAVLIVLHQDWLANDPTRREWCMDSLRSVLESPPAPSELEVAESVNDLWWDTFAAECMVTLLAEEPQEARIRQLAAEFVTSHFYGTTAIAMRSAFRSRERLADDFVRLQNLAILWAGVRAIMDTARRCDSDITRWEGWRAHIIAEFRDRGVPPDPLKWEKVGRIGQLAMHRIEKQRYPGIDDTDDVAHDDYEPCVATGLRRQRGWWGTHPGLDGRVLQSAFGWIPSLDMAGNPSERAAWVALLREGLGVTLSMLPRTAGIDDDLEGTPYEYDEWIFGQIAVAVCFMTAEERPSQLWQPILDLGAPAHYWVSSFLTAWFTDAARAAPSPAEFVERWKEMIDHALQSARWSDCDGRSGYHLTGLMIELMGLDWYSRSLDEPGYAAAIATLEPQFQVFSRDWLSVPQVASRFASFLARPAGAALLCVGIRWLHTAVSRYEDYCWQEEALADNLAEALRACWIKETLNVQREPELRSAFQGLLGLLIRRQNAAAFELRHEVVRSVGE